MNKTTSPFRELLSRRLAYLIGTMPVFGSQLYDGKPVCSTLLDDLEAEELTALYEQAIQAYWRSVLVHDEGYKMEPAPIDCIRRTDAIRVFEQSPVPSSVKAALELLNAIPTAKALAPKAPNLHREAATKTALEKSKELLLLVDEQGETESETALRELVIREIEFLLKE